MTALPNAAELHRMARAGTVPGAFFDATEDRRRLNDELAQTRATLHDLIREAHKQGVGPAVLARWSGYDPSRIFQILG
jgi:hypothetical protein